MSKKMTPMDYAEAERTAIKRLIQRRMAIWAKHGLDDAVEALNDVLLAIAGRAKRYNRRKGGLGK